MAEKNENVLKRVKQFQEKKKETSVSQRFYLSIEYNEKFKKLCQNKGMTKEQITMFWIDKESN